MKVIEGVKGTREGRMQNCTHLATPEPFSARRATLQRVLHCHDTKALHDAILSKFTREEAETHQDVTYFFVWKRLGRIGLGFWCWWIDGIGCKQQKIRVRGSSGCTWFQSHIATFSQLLIWTEDELKCRKQKAGSQGLDDPKVGSSTGNIGFRFKGNFSTRWIRCLNLPLVYHR